MSQRICDVDGCDKPHRARGLCSTHYNQAHAELAHPKIPVECVCCGTVTMKHPSKRYGARFCSYLCRDFTKFGPMSCPLPVRREPKPEPAPLPPRDCEWCGRSFQPRRATQAYCETRCSHKAGKVRRRGRESQAGGTYTWTEVIGIFLKFGRRCAYCQQPISGQPDPDHVVALSRGGSNSITNILPACSLCNSDKRHLSLEEWAADRLRRGVEPRVTTWSAEDQRYRHLTSVLAA